MGGAPTVERVGGGALGPLLTGEWDCNVYLVRGRKRSVLVDAGAGVPSLVPPAGADAVLLTHLHFDHSGGAASLVRRGLRVMAHPWTAEGLRNGDGERSGLTISQQRGFYPAEFRLESCGAGEIDDGATLDLGGCLVTAVATPGHADGHLSFLVEDDDGRRTLLAGDLVFPGGCVVLQPLPDCRLDALWESLARVRALAPDALYAGHGEPVETDAAGHLDLALAAFASGGIPAQLET